MFIINKKINKKCRKNPHIIDENNGRITSQIDIAHTMNDYFSVVGEKLNKIIPKSQSTINMR